MSALLLATLGVVCPSCDELNPPRSVTCKSCGSSLDGGAKPAAAPAPRPPTSPQVPLAAAPRTPTQSGIPRIAPAGTPSSPAPAAGPHATVAPPGAAVPPGMRPTQRPAPVATFPDAHAPASRPPAAPHAPVSASELTRKAPAAALSKLGVMVISGSGAGQRFRLAGSAIPVGKSRASILFPDDPFVSAHHATLLPKDNRLSVRDEQSASGVFVTVAQELLKPGQFFSAGRRLFRYVGPAEAPQIVPGRPVVYGAPVPSSQTIYVVEEILVGGRPGRAVTTAGPLLTIGQALCDLSFTDDPGMATRHCELSPTPQGALLRDLSGGLGTYVRISGERPLNPGDRIRIGDQVLQVEVVA